MIKGKSLVELSVDLAAGTITEEMISEALGEGTLNKVLAIGGGIISGVAAAGILNIIENETGLVSDMGSLVDDVFSIFD